MKYKFLTGLLFSSLICGLFLLSLPKIAEAVAGDASSDGDTASQGPIISYTFTNVQAEHTISVSFVAASTLEIRDITTNLSAYPDSQVPEYEKLEISFQIDTEAKNLQFPYDPTPPVGVDTSLDRYNGITVNAVFEDPQGNRHRQPAFYYQEFLEDESKDWYYPTENYMWKVRFAPNAAGTWQFKLQAQDDGNYPNWEETKWQSFTVVDSNNRGFIKVSETDSRYFEFDNGDYFPGLGYNENYRGIDWVKPVQNNQDKFQIMGENGIQYTRHWLSQWPIFGSAWAPWKPHVGNGYLVAANLNFADGIIYPFSELSMKIYMGPDANNPGSYIGNRCMFWGWETTNFPAKSGSTYRVRVRYQLTDNIGPRIAGNPHGFAVKTGGWLWSDGDFCYDSGVGGLIAATYNSNQVLEDNPANPNGWKILQGEFTPDGDFFPSIYLALENVEEASVYVDHVWIEEMDPTTKEVMGPNVVEKPDMDHHLYFEQRGSLAFDKVVELAKQHNVYLRPVIHEKNDWIFSRIGYDGAFTDFNNENFYGEYRNNNIKMRWLQQAWWRYLQARWGYSTNIHSWELLNEGDPDVYNLQLSKVGKHQMLADELGEFMHCTAFGVAAGGPDSQHQCTYDHPNAHMVSTSHWHSFPWHFWANKHPEKIDNGNEDWDFSNIDFADVHSYVNDSTDPLFDDVALMVQTESLKWGKKLPDPASVGKPVIRGETSLGDNSSPILQDTQGVWLHNFIWAQINAGGLYDSSWWQNGYKHIYNRADGLDFRPLFKPYYNFVSTIPLNNGHYDDAQAQVTHPDLRAWGQKDVVHGKAHLWIQNKQHTWRNVVDGVPINPIAGTVTVPNMRRGPYTVEWWDTTTGTVIKTEEVDSDPALVLTLPHALVDDLAVKINWAGPDLSLSSKSVNRVAARHGDTLTYTITLINTGPEGESVVLTDSIPPGTSYVAGSARVSPATGTLEDWDGIHWSGVLADTAVEISFAVIVETAKPQTIVNTAIIDDGFSELRRQASTVANGYKVYLPILMRR
jgi:uncharacterized repeat protein (TIGR01451 family)